jgi:phosphoadenosine phosphosulfate reductase
VAAARQTLYGPEPLYVADSGGKDSGVIVKLMDLAGVPCDCHHNVTGIDPPQVYQFLRRHRPQTQFHTAGVSMWDVVEANGIPPTHRMRYCCDLFKERGGEGRVIAQGVRWEESEQRSRRGFVEQCIKGNGRTFLNPIIDWTSDDVWEFHRAYNLPYCELYDQGFERIGCVLCPLAGRRERLLQFERCPHMTLLWKRACDRAYEHRRRKGRPLKWKSGADMFWWWLLDVRDNSPWDRESDQEAFDDLIEDGDEEAA